MHMSCRFTVLHNRQCYGACIGQAGSQHAKKCTRFQSCCKASGDRPTARHPLTTCSASSTASDVSRRQSLGSMAAASFLASLPRTAMASDGRLPPHDACSTHRATYWTKALPRCCIHPKGFQTLQEGGRASWSRRPPSSRSQMACTSSFWSATLPP